MKIMIVFKLVLNNSPFCHWLNKQVAPHQTHATGQAVAVSGWGASPKSTVRAQVPLNSIGNDRTNIVAFGKCTPGRMLKKTAMFR